MNVLFALVNIFFVPALSVWIAYRREGEEPKWSANLMLRCAIYTALDLPAGAALAFALKRLLHKSMSADTIRYTPAALAAAFLVPYIVEMVRAGLPVRFFCHSKVPENFHDK